MTRAALVLLGGCTTVFGLESPTRTVVQDAEPVPTDARLDAPQSCTPLVNDEDGDAIDDACDACPTVPSDQMDADGDGLPNACDADLAQSGDRILLARMFTAESELADLDPGTAQWSSTGNGVVVLEDNGRLRVSGLAATMIELRVIGFIGTDQIEIKAGPTCKLRPGPCAGNGTGMCLELTPTSADLGAAPSELRQVRLAQSAGMARCDATASGQLTTVTGSGTIGTGTIEVKIGLDSMLVVQSLVVYGAK